MINYNLKGKVVLVTGAGQGIGKAAAIAVAKSGANVILCGRTYSKVEKAAEEVESWGVQALPISMDISKVDEVYAAVEKGVERFGHIDALLNSAGIWKPRNIIDMTPDFWDEIIGINLRGATFMASAVAKQMVEKKIPGSIILVSSQAAKMGEYGNSAYGSAKNALHTLTQCMALELAEYNINTVAICPGSINTEMIRDVIATRSADCGMNPDEYERKVMCSKIPMDRLGKPEEVGNLMAWLISEDAHYITGVTLTIAGGQTII